MLEGVRAKLDGKKTYIISIVGILVGLVGLLFGPVDLGPINIPKITYGEFWSIVWNGGLFSALRVGLTKETK